MQIEQKSDYTVILQKLVDKIWNNKKYFVVVPHFVFLGHLFWEIIMAVSMARKSNRKLILLKPHNDSMFGVINRDVFNCELNCDYKRYFLGKIIMWILFIFERLRN